MQAPKTPPPLTLPPAVNAPVKKKLRYRFFNSPLECSDLFGAKNDGYETPDDQPTEKNEPPKLVRKKK